MTEQELYGTGLRWAEIINQDHSVHEAQETINDLLSHIREQEVYKMLYKIERTELEASFSTQARDGGTWAWYIGFRAKATDFDSWQSAVRDAYKTLIEEATG